MAKNDGVEVPNSSYAPEYAGIVYSGVPEGEKASGPGNSYAEVSLSGVAFPGQGDGPPAFPENTSPERCRATTS